MVKIVSFVTAMVIQFIAVPAYAYELKYSGKTDRWDNPFIAYGYNPVSKITIAAPNNKNDNAASCPAIL